MNVPTVWKRRCHVRQDASTRRSGCDVVVQAVGRAPRLQARLNHTAHFGVRAQRPGLHRRDVLLGCLWLEGLAVDLDRDLERRLVGRTGREACPVDPRARTRKRLAELQLPTHLAGGDGFGLDDTEGAHRTASFVDLPAREFLATRG